MRIMQINGGVFGSTGNIMFSIAKTARKQGHEVICASPVTTTNRNREPEHEYVKIGTFYGRCLNILLARITGYEGCFSMIPTMRLIRKMRKFAPDILHLHSIHNSYLNLPLLFRYVRKSKMKIMWTLHDCWAFTGHCPHFENIECEKWKTGCRDCPLYQRYPKSYFDNAKKMYYLKKKWFTKLPDMTILTPSAWLADKVKESFLKEYSVEVVHNGIDLSVFQPVESEFRKKYNCVGKCILLGVSFGWDNSKGLDVFIKLAQQLEKDYQVVLVGTDDALDQILPENIVSIHRTQNQAELAEIYTVADLYVNPTREDTFPTVNLEALACGTPVITYRTGGSPEVVNDICGKVVEKDDFDELIKVIKESREMKKQVTYDCIARARQFNKETSYDNIYTFDSCHPCDGMYNKDYNQR